MVPDASHDYDPFQPLHTLFFRKTLGLFYPLVGNRHAPRCACSTQAPATTSCSLPKLDMSQMILASWANLLALETTRATSLYPDLVIYISRQVFTIFILHGHKLLPRQAPSLHYESMAHARMSMSRAPRIQYSMITIRPANNSLV